jgi:hypothetical protein
VLGSENTLPDSSSRRPEDKYLVYLYTNGLQVHLSFLLDKRKPKTLPEAHKMAMEIEKSLFMTKTDAMDTLSMMKLVSHKDFVEDTQEKGNKLLTSRMRTLIRSKNLNKMMKYPPVLLPPMKSCKNLFLLYSKVKKRLVTFRFKMLMTPCIQKMKKKWKPGRSRSPLL